SANLDESAISGLLRLSHIPAPFSVFEGVEKIKPGYYATITKEDDGWNISHHEYWSSAAVGRNAARNPFRGTLTEATELLSAKLSKVVKRQMLSDVPIGAFLSGGVDSSLIAASMQENSSRAIRTFTIGFNDPSFDESPRAKQVAEFLGTEHTEHRFSSNEAMHLVPSLASHYDEPFADASQLPTLLLSRITREHVTVALSGDGGDELFGGYNRHLWATSRANRILSQSELLRRTLANLAKLPTDSSWERLAALLRATGSGAAIPSELGRKVAKVAEGLQAGSPFEAYIAARLTGWKLPRVNPALLSQAQGVWIEDDSLLNNMRLADTNSYLPDSVLTKVDRAAMSVGLETRIPFLDHEVFEFAWTLPSSFLINQNQGKRILREAFAKKLPREMLARAKSGFTVPLGAWLRSGLRDWTEAMLDENALRTIPQIDAEAVRSTWRQHLAGTTDRSYDLWPVLMLRSWLLNREASAPLRKW
ncbi:asparagine synthase C-terminal domain-containing protein, partial [bacterium]|nr:asparagine synthase C-terminal domain-containing protein [bacterium]